MSIRALSKVGIVIAMFLIVALVNAWAQPTISIDSKTVIAQQLPQNVNISVYIASVKNCTGIGFNLTFDPNIVEVVDVKENKTYFNVSVVDYNVNNEIGFLHVAVIAYDKITTADPKPFVDITFKAINYGKSNLNFTFAEYSLDNFNVTDINKVNGTITVQKVFYFNVQGNAKILWNASYENASLLKIADLNDDGRDDVVFASGSGNTYNVYALDGSNGNEMWNIPLGSDKPYFAKADDLNGDGKKDVIVIAEKTIVGIRNDGDELLIFYHNDSISFSEEMTYAVDVDGDGFKEIITGGWGSSWNNYYVIAIDSGYNNEKWVRKFGGWTQIIASKEKESPVKIANVVNVKGYFTEFNFDFDKDGKGDVLLYYWKYIGDGQYESHFEAVDGENGNTIWDYNTTDEVYFYSKSGDSNGDGYDDLLLGGENKWIILSGKDGKVWRSMDQQLISGCYDIDKDGVCEFLTYENGTVYIRDGSGDVEWNFNFGNYSDIYALKTTRKFVIGKNYYWENETTYLKIVKLEQDDYGRWFESWSFEKNFTGYLSYYATITDLTGDGINDLLFIGHYSHVLALDGANGNELWFRYVYNLAYIGDFDGDGKSDVFNVTEITHGEYARSGEGLTGDGLAYIFNVSTSDYFRWYFNWFNPFKTYDVNGDGCKDLVFIVNPNSPDSKIYAVGVKQPPKQMPDLTVDISVPSSVKKGTSVIINVTVKNIGSATSDSTKLDLYIDGNKVKTFDVPQLNAGDKEKFSYQYVFTSEGIHEIKAIVDPNDNVEERNENNNVATKYIEVYAPKPDLIGILHVYDEFGNETWTIKMHKAGDSYNGKRYNYPFVVVNVTFEIRNLGYPNASVTKPFSVSGVYKDKNFTYDLTDEELNDLNEDGVLYIHEEAVVNATEYKLSCKCYPFNITVDPDNVINETNEENNKVSYKLCISKPDLVPILVMPKKRVIPGEYEFTVGVKNIGDVWAKETKLKVLVNGKDWKVFSIPMLQPNETWTKNVTYNFAGLTNITVIADVNDDEAELNESNNAVSKVVIAKWIYVNATVIPGVSKAKLNDVFNVSIILNTTEAIGKLNLLLTYDYHVLQYVSATSNYSLTFNDVWYKYPFRAVRINGNNLNLNGTFVLANVKFRVKTDKAATVWLNLSGDFWSKQRLPMKLNSTNASVLIEKVTDIRPYIYGYYTKYVVGDKVKLYVSVKNLRSTWSNPYNLTVEVYNKSGLQAVVFSRYMPPLKPYGWNVTKIVWNTSGLSGGIYWIVAKVDNDTYTKNNEFKSWNITLKAYKLDVWKLWYPYWRVLKNSTFYIGCYVNVTAPGYVNVTIKVPEGLTVWDWSNKTWTNSVTVKRFLWGGKWNWIGFRAKAIEVGKYGNGTPYEINITVVGRDKQDVINSTKSKDPTDWVPKYSLTVWVPKIKLTSLNTTVLTQRMNESSMTFKTLNWSKVKTFNQTIRIVVMAGSQGRILQGLDYLVHYPFGCVEQITSRLLGALHTDWYYREVAKSYPKGYDRNKINKTILMGVKKLAKGGTRGQHDNGSWSMWGWYKRGDAFYTTYASYGLGRIAEDEAYYYLVKKNLTAQHKVSGKFNFNDTIYWYNITAIREFAEFNNTTLPTIHWHPKQGSHGFFGGDLPLTAMVMVTFYQLNTSGLLNDSAKELANDLMANVTNYLLSHQSYDGGWNQKGDKSKSSDALATALAVWGLKLYGTPTPPNVTKKDIQNAIKKGINWLMENYVTMDGKVYWKRYPSAWWDWYGRNAETTAYVLLALNESRSVNGIVTQDMVYDATNDTIAKAVEYLISIYRQHGSFGYTAATQAALHALTKLQYVSVSPITVKVTIDGVVEREITVNNNNPKKIVELTLSVNKKELEAINDNGTPINDGKRLLHNVTVQRISGDGIVIVSVENEQVVAKTDVVWNVHYIGAHIKSYSTSKGTIRINTLDSDILAQPSSNLTIDVTLPEMKAGEPCVATVKITNNVGDIMTSPIVNITFANLEFNRIISAYDSALGDITDYVNDPRIKTYDTNANLLTLRMQQIPANGYVELKLNVTPKGAGNASINVKVTPIYNEGVSFVKVTSAPVAGFGNVILNIVDVNGKPINASVFVDNTPAIGNIVSVLEGKRHLKVEKAGYIPVEFDINITAGTNKSYTVVMVTPNNLTEPKVIFGEGDFSDLVSMATVLGNISIKPNATVKAKQVFNVSISGVGKKIIAIRVPKWPPRGSLWAWLNDSIKIDVNGQVITPKEYTIGNEKVLLIEINESASVNISFEGRRLGDIPGTTEGVDIADAMFIAQYDVGLRNFDNKAMVYADIPGTTAGVDIADAMFIAQYDVGLRNADYLSYS